MTTRETALAALFAALETVPGALVLRDPDTDIAVPAAGAIVLRDGSADRLETLLSPLAYSWAHQADIEVYAQHPDAATRRTTVDDLLAAIGTALDADRTLGGAVDYVATEAAPEITEEPVEGAPTVRQALVTVTLYYTTSDALA